MTTKIEWAQETWNPITGCSKISEGCQNCYAERMAKRLAGRSGYPKADPFKVTFHPERLTQPHKWKKPRMIFVCSMGDLFHEGVDPGWLTDVFGVMHRNPQHTFILLTKRPENVPAHKTWHRKNIWLGVTAENQQRADERIPTLLKIPAAVRFVSVEPMLGPVLLTDMEGADIYKRRWLEDWIVPGGDGGGDTPGLDWVICGGETGRGARLMAMGWARSLRDQCEAAQVPFFFKKRGEWWRKQFNTNPKHLSNRELDGRVYEQYPEVE